MILVMAWMACVRSGAFHVSWMRSRYERGRASEENVGQMRGGAFDGGVVVKCGNGAK